jgi:hypothetical protein
MLVEELGSRKAAKATVSCQPVLRYHVKRAVLVPCMNTCVYVAGRRSSLHCSRTAVNNQRCVQGAGCKQNASECCNSRGTDGAMRSGRKRCFLLGKRGMSQNRLSHVGARLSFYIGKVATVHMHVLKHATVASPPLRPPFAPPSFPFAHIRSPFVPLRPPSSSPFVLPEEGSVYPSCLYEYMAGAGV